MKSSKRPYLSFIICTYNRADILAKCLPFIITDLKLFNQVELIIVDNNSSDKTEQVVKTFFSKYQNFFYAKEEKIGLSHARNKGFEVANSEWIIYIDDDARLRNKYIERVFYLIENYDFDCFGGMYFAWFLFGKPKWLPKEFGNKRIVRKTVGLIDGKSGWLTGNNLVVKKSVLEDVGGFDSNFGMTGNTIAYGEEDDLQRKILDKGYKLGFDPELIIDHAVLPHKLKMLWHLKNSYAKGRYSQKQKNLGSYIQIAFQLLKSIPGGLLKHLPRSIMKMMTKKEYYFQNLVLDTCSPTLWFLGVFISKINND